MATFILVHGGGHGGWCYNKVGALLRAAGHLVLSPSLSGCGDRTHLASPTVGLDTHITDIVNLMTWDDLTDVILVGHSYGGMVITGVADRAADRIRELVYLDAAHPADGQSLRATAPASIEPTRAGLRPNDQGADMVMWPFPGMAAMFGVTDPADVAWVDARLTPHPWKCYDEPLVLRNGDAAARLPRTNVNCTGSLAHSSAEDRARQLDGDRNYEVDTGHDLMITEAARVAEILLEVAQTPAR